MLCVGRATRLVEFFHLLPKSYEATLRLGVETTTHDPTGEPSRGSEAWQAVGTEELEAALRAHTGRIEQRPPAFSAKRVRGRRAYEVARRGEDVALEPVSVTVHALRLLSFEPPEVRLTATVSTGTYVRSLARDIGRHLGCGAHLRQLRRMGIGPFRAEAALPEERLDAGLRWEARGERGWWLEPAEALAWLPRRELDEGEAAMVRHGSSVPRGRVSAPDLAVADGLPENGFLPVVLLHRGRLVAVAERRDGTLHPRKVFPDV